MNPSLNWSVGRVWSWSVCLSSCSETRIWNIQREWGFSPENLNGREEWMASPSFAGSTHSNALQGVCEFSCLNLKTDGTLVFSSLLLDCIKHDLWFYRSNNFIFSRFFFCGCGPFEFVTILFLCYGLLFWPGGMWDRTLLPGSRRGCPHHWTAREAPRTLVGSGLFLECRHLERRLGVTCPLYLKLLFHANLGDGHVCQ